MSYLTDFKCEPDRNRRNNNDSGYCDKEMDALLAKAETESSPDRSKVLLGRIVAKMHEDLPELHVGFVGVFRFP